MVELLQTTRIKARLTIFGQTLGINEGVSVPIGPRQNDGLGHKVLPDDQSFMMMLLPRRLSPKSMIVVTKASYFREEDDAFGGYIQDLG